MLYCWHCTALALHYPATRAGCLASASLPSHSTPPTNDRHVRGVQLPLELVQQLRIVCHRLGQDRAVQGMAARVSTGQENGMDEVM